jgi:hypothetical protein
MDDFPKFVRAVLYEDIGSGITSAPANQIFDKPRMVFFRYQHEPLTLALEASQ